MFKLSRWWPAGPGRYRKNTSAPALPGLQYPLQGKPRIAVLGLRLRAEENQLYFPHWTCHQIMRLNPEAIAGPLPELLEVARVRDEGYLTMPALNLPLVVFSTLQAGVLSARERERLWAAYGLPFFEQIRDREGRLLAYECDARDGFHWVGEEVGTHLARPVLCACGRMATKTPTSEQTESAAQATTGW